MPFSRRQSPHNHSKQLQYQLLFLLLVTLTFSECLSVELLLFSRQARIRLKLMDPYIAKFKFIFKPKTLLLQDKNIFG